jgi:hypothetical protein
LLDPQIDRSLQQTRNRGAAPPPATTNGEEGAEMPFIFLGFINKKMSKKRKLYLLVG